MNSVIIVAAGSGSRMNMGINKQFLKIGDKEILAHTIEKFYNNKCINEIILVTREEDKNYLQKNIIEIYGYENIKIVTGGKERQNSVYNGLKEVNPKCKIVLIHDGARPFVSEKIIQDCIDSCKKYKAVVVGVPVKDTIKIVNENYDVVDTPNRNNLWSVQTPQTFDYNLIIKAYEKAFSDDFYGTDDSMLVEYLGHKVKIINGEYDNIKITTQEDLKIGSEILK